MIDIEGLIDSLSREEKLDLMERLWDNLTATREELPVPEWQIELIDERLADHRRNPSDVRDAYKMIDEKLRRYE